MQHLRLRNLLITLWLLFFTLSAHALQNTARTDVENAYKNWCAAIATAKGDPSVMVKFYAPNAILVATLSPKILFNTHGGLNDYFTTFTQHPNIHCSTDQLITKVYGNIAINSGLYTFTYDDNGQTVTVPARFTFVYKKSDESWLIINHHSSKVPS